LINPLRTPELHRTMATAMGKRLEGKTVIVTGASSGIGKSTAIEFARTSPKNLKLILTARRIDTLKQIAEEIKQEVGDGVKVLPVQLDISKPDQVRSFIPNLPQEFQDIDVLINNAGLVKGVDTAGNIKEEDINIMFDTNVTGLINMTQACLGVFRKRGESGQGDIINIGSIAGREGYPGGSIYCATKAAIRTFTEAIRKELIATRIRVIEIDPGQVETEFSVVRFGGDKAKADAVYKGVTPLTPEDIAETIVFAAGRPENVVIADMLVFPNHQVSRDFFLGVISADLFARARHKSCTGDRERMTSDFIPGVRWRHVQTTCRTRLEDLDLYIYPTSTDPAATSQSSSAPQDPDVPSPPRSTDTSHESSYPSSPSSQSQTIH
jgi:3-hydroxy acid dehydrogenase / malonic semialdehyde reductase